MTTSLEEVRDFMDDEFAAGTAYQVELPFDRLRAVDIARTVKELAGALGRDTGTRVLDLGCGQGGIAAFWSHQNIVGVEISHEAVAMAQAQFPQVQYHVSAVEDFKWTGEPFLLATAVETIEHWVDVPAGLAAVRACMAQGGKLIVTTPNRDSLHCRIGRKLGIEPPYCSDHHIYEYRFQELIDVVSACGFAVEESRGVHLAPVWSLENVVGNTFRYMTNNDVDVNNWLNDIAAHAPAEYAFIQCHRFRAV